MIPPIGGLLVGEKVWKSQLTKQAPGGFSGLDRARTRKWISFGFPWMTASRGERLPAVSGSQFVPKK